MVKVHGILVMTLLEMLKFVVWIKVPHLILIMEKKDFLVLGGGPTDGINGSTGAAEEMA